MTKLLWILLACLGIFNQPLPKVANPIAAIKANKLYYNYYGYYLPNKHIILKHSQIQCLEIMPKQLKDSNPYEIKLWLDELNGKVTKINAGRFKLDPRHSYFKFKTKADGAISISGRFTRKVGPFDDPGVQDKTIVFRGNIMIKGTSTPLAMTWWEGD